MVVVLWGGGGHHIKLRGKPISRRQILKFLYYYSGEGNIGEHIKFWWNSELCHDSQWHHCCLQGDPTLHTPHRQAGRYVSKATRKERDKIMHDRACY